MIRWVFAFSATFLASGALTFGLAALDVSPWPMLGLFLVVGFALMAIRPIEAMLPSTLTLYACLFVMVFVISLPESPNPRLGAARFAVTLLLLIASSIAFILMFMRSRGRESAFPWLLAAILMGVFVAFISGDKGSAEPMRSTLQGWLPAWAAEAMLWTIRKSIHVAYYGLMAWTVFRAGRSVGVTAPLAALSFAVAHGAFDEYRQFAASRTRFGTPTDILFDLGGALLVLSVAGAFRTSAPKKRQME